jgi:probable addiction module antidote protein
MTEWTLFDPADYLETEDDMAEYLAACLEDPNPDVFLAALGDVAKARGMAEIAERSGLGRESLYKALSAGAHPRHETVRKVIEALGLRMTITKPLADHPDVTFPRLSI